MFKRQRDDHPVHTQRPGKLPNLSSSPASVQKFDSEAADFTSTSELSTSSRRIAVATFLDFTPANDDPHRFTDDIARGSLASCAPSCVVESRRQATCFRISGIPSDWSMDDLKRKLQVIDSQLCLTDVDLSKPFPACCDSTQTALLNFDNCTEYFRKLKRNDEKQIVIRETNPDRKVRLMIDKHFYDLSPMNRPVEPIVAELVQSLLFTIFRHLTCVCTV